MNRARLSVSMAGLCILLALVLGTFIFKLNHPSSVEPRGSFLHHDGKHHG